MTLAKIRHLKDGRGKEGRGGAAWKGKESLGLLERAEGGGQCCPCCDREHNRLRLCCCCCCRVAKISSAAVLQTGSLSLSVLYPTEEEADPTVCCRSEAPFLLSLDPPHSACLSG